MTKLERVQLFLNFWFSPWGAAKGEIWESFENDRPFTDASAEEVIQEIMRGHDHNWRELESYKHCL